MRTERSTINEWARLGAAQRLTELDRERSTILRLFPGIKPAGGDGPSAPVPAIKQRRMSAAAKRRMSAGMRKYWAKRRAAEAKKSTTN